MALPTSGARFRSVMPAACGLKDLIMQDAWVVPLERAEQETLSILQRFGVAIIPNALEPSEHSRLCQELDPFFRASAFCEGLFYGSRTKRFGRVLARSRAAGALALDKLALDPARSVLGPSCEDIQLNLTQAIEIWPGSLSQVPHRDQDIWSGAKQPGEMMINAMWALDDFTPENGATLLWPGSHRTPDIVLPDCAGVAATMPRGSLCLFLGSTIHAGGANSTNRPRRGLVISYCLGWLKPCENPWLSYPPEVATGFSAELARLAGYRQDAPSLNNVDGACPSLLLRPGEKRAPFRDNLSAEQIGLIQDYNDAQANHVALAA
jgi:hypothetical protein